MTAASFEQSYGGWIGYNVGELTGAWGEPKTINNTGNGRKEYGYNLTSSKQDPSREKQLPDTCLLYFIVNLTGVIEAIRHEGNLCRSAPALLRGLGG